MITSNAMVAPMDVDWKIEGWFESQLCEVGGLMIIFGAFNCALFYSWGFGLPETGLGQSVQTTFGLWPLCFRQAWVGAAVVFLAVMGGIFKPNRVNSLVAAALFVVAAFHLADWSMLLQSIMAEPEYVYALCDGFFLL